MSKIVRLSFAVLMAVALSAVTMAQSTTAGGIGGVVNNPNKEVVPGAAVTVRNIETNKEDTTTTDDQGRFRVVNLQPGTYSVTINASGFGQYSQDSVVVEVGRETNINANLSIGAVQGTVEVTSEAPVINTTQQDFSTNINQTSINELPINGRRWSNFALLTPGAVPDGTFGLISFRGISGLLNNNTIDGGDNNQAFFAEERGRTRISYSISQAAIQEFQVNTSSYSAEYGRSAGGVVNAVTKSGTNEFHGSGFYYQRNNKWGARNPRSFATQNVNGAFVPVAFKPKDVRHQFGGTIGGPIVKDKAFFFFSYDQQKRNFPGVATFGALDYLNRVDTCLLTAAAGATVTLAACPQFAGTVNPSRTGSLATGKGLTVAQVNNALSFLNSLTGEVPRKGDQKLFLPKVDWHINDNHTLTATYNRLRWDSPAGVQTQAINTRARDNFGDDFVNIDSLNLRLASTFPPNLVNEFRFQWGRDNETQFSQPPFPGEPTNSVNGRSPQVNLGGGNACFAPSGFCFGIPEFLDRAAFPDERRWQFADTVTLTAGNHTVKWGGDINFVKDIISNLRFGGGEFVYSGGPNSVGFQGSLNDFIIDYTNFITSGGLPATSPCYSSTRTRGRCYGGNFNQGLGVLGLTMKTQDYNIFVQDDWRMSPRLTLNLGLRYEYQKNPDPINVNPQLPQTANRADDRNNFGPRIGFAYDVTGDGKTSVRGGWGVYYGRVINSTIYNALINTGVGVDRAQRQVGILASNAAAPVFPNLLSAGTLAAPAVQYFAPNFQLPLIHQLDAVVEREIARNTVISASYLFSYGKSLPNFVDINLPPPTRLVTFTASGGPFSGQNWVMPLFTGNRLATNYAQITEIRSDVFSKYNALVLQANRRLTNGLQFQTSYTLSRSADDGQSSTTFTSNNLPFNAFDQLGENSLSNFDRRHKFVASVVYNTNFTSLKDNAAARAILNGWTFAPIFNAFSGARYTATVSGTVSPGGATGSAPGSGNFGFLGFAPGTVTPGGGINGSGGSTRFALVPRNFFKQPSIQYVDLRISRRFGIGEKAKIEVLGEAFNLFNRTQVTSVSASIYSIPGSGNVLTFNGGASGFQSVTGADSTLFRERQIQLALRFEF
jgi:Carboxypeptidase regulatory-like domain/TonB dependent receptor-like, beta-barrel